MKEIYLVVSGTGVYEDFIRRTVCAYSEKEKADSHAKLANERAMLCRFSYNNYSIRDESNEPFGPLDPKYSPRYSGKTKIVDPGGSNSKGQNCRAVTYSVETIQILNEVPECKSILKLRDIDFSGVIRVSIRYSSFSTKEFERVYEKDNLLCFGRVNEYYISLDTECEIDENRIVFMDKGSKVHMTCYYPTQPSLKIKD